MMSRRCPHCGGSLSTLYDRTRAERLRDLGLCVDCQTPKTDAEIARGHWRCRDCRLKRARKAQARR